VVTEWVEGTKLSDLMAQAAPMEVGRVAAVVENAAAALASAHRQGIVHEELRPEDITLVTVLGIGGEGTKLDGLGVASALARSGSWPPSPYRAPEQNLPDGAPPSPQSDQYALAAIAYELLSGTLPFSDETSKVLETPRSLMDLAPAVTPTMDLVIRQALARDPAARFSGVVEFARALRNATPGANIALTRVRPAAPLTWVLQRLKSASWTGALVRFGLVPAALLLVAGTGVVTWRRPQTRPRMLAELASSWLASPTIAPRQPLDRPAPSEPDPTALLQPEPAKSSGVASPPPRAVRRVRPPRSGGRRVASASRTGPTTATAVSDLCLISVESKPPAHVWLDGRSIGRQTPLLGYRVACGKHKLALKRKDLHLSRVEAITSSVATPFRHTYRLR
jgi:serine/threonine-protein kinase